MANAINNHEGNPPYSTPGVKATGSSSMKLAPNSKKAVKVREGKNVVVNKVNATGSSSKRKPTSQPLMTRNKGY